MIVALIILIVVMALSSVVVLVMAVCEFVLSIRQSRLANNEDRDEAAISAPVEEKPESDSEEPFCAVEENNSSETDDNNVSFEANDSQRLTLEEAYGELSDAEKAYFDKIVAASKELPFARIIESTYAYTVMQGRDTIARLRILRGVVTLDCTVVNADLIKYNKENGKKIRNKPVRFRVQSDEDLDAAIYTLQVANAAALETRNIRKKLSDKKDEESVGEVEAAAAEDAAVAEAPVEEAVAADADMVVSAEELDLDDAPVAENTEPAADEAIPEQVEEAAVVADEEPIADAPVEPVAEEIAAEEPVAEDTADAPAEKKNSYVDGPIIVELEEFVIDEGDE